MKIEIIKNHKGLKKGVQVDIDPAYATTLISQEVAKKVSTAKPKAKTKR